MSTLGPYIKKLVLHFDGQVGHTIKCRQHPKYSPRERKPSCQWCLALFYMVKAQVQKSRISKSESGVAQTLSAEEMKV